MAFWSGERLKEHGKRLQVVYGFNPKKIDCSAYTLTLGPEAFVTPDYSIALRDSRKLQLTEARDQKVGRRSGRCKGGEVVIPAGQFAILLTDEFVKIPRATMGFISLKFSIKGTGLVNVSGFHVDPGYEGRLIFSVYNAAPTAISMTRGQDLFLLWLADLDRASAPPYVKVPGDQITTSLPEDMVSRANHPIRSVEQLSKKIDELDNELSFFKRVVGVAFVIIMAGVSIAGMIFAGVRFLAETPASNTTSESANVAADAAAHGSQANQIGNGSRS